MIVDMLQYYNLVKGFDIDIIYSGTILADCLTDSCDTLRKRLEFDDLPLSSVRAVFSVFVEQMSNMLLYSTRAEHEESQSNPSKGIFLLGAKGNKFFLLSGNMMKSDCVDLIKKRIDYLNTLDKPGLRKYYMERIKCDDDNPESLGAGLGLIEIARRSSSPIGYKFTPLENGFSFFSMQVII